MGGRVAGGDSGSVTRPSSPAAPLWAHGVASGAARGASAAALYGAVLLPALWLLEAGDPPPPGESGYLPVGPTLLLVFLVTVPTVAVIAGTVGSVLGALIGGLLSPLVVRQRERPGPLAAAVGAVLVAGGSWLLRDLDLAGP